MRVALLLGGLSGALCASPLISSLTLGVDYYPTTWGPASWDADAAAMARANISIVRVAEFSWHEFQPTLNGPYNFSWLDASLSVLSSHGIRAIVGTPTASPPSWLYKDDPSIALVDARGLRVGTGSRQNLNHLHPRVLKETRSIVAAIAEHYATDPRVAGWQIDNEIHGEEDFSPITLAAFREWLSVKYGGSIAALNSAWGSTFWGLSYDAFDEVPLPMTTTDGDSPSFMLDYRRFIADVAGSYLELQAGLLRAGAPDKPIAHNCMGTYLPVDYSRFGRSLDVVAFDNYPLSWWSPTSGQQQHSWAAASELRIYGTALQAAFMRGAGEQRPFYVMEEQVANTGQLAYYGSYWPEGIRLAAWQMVANGANGVQFFRWRTTRWGVEQHWEGLLNWDGSTSTRRFDMAVQLGGEFARASPAVFGLRVRARVAILHSPETRWTLADAAVTQPALAVEPQMTALLAAFRSHALDVDVVFIPADTGHGAPLPLPDLSGYAVVVAPSLTVVPRSVADALTTFAEAGGQVLFTMRSGSKDENDVYPDTPLPGLLAHIAGLTMAEWDPSCSLGEVAVNVTSSGGQSFPFPPSTPFGLICEIIEPSSPTTEVLAMYGHGYYAGRPAVTRNRVGVHGGGVMYAGTFVSGEDGFCEWLASRLAADAHLAWAPRLPYGVEVSTRGDGSGGGLTTFVLNWNAGTTVASVPSAGGGTDVLTGTRIDAAGTVSLGPWGVAVVRVE